MIRCTHQKNWHTIRDVHLARKIRGSRHMLDETEPERKKRQWETKTGKEKTRDTKERKDNTDRNDRLIDMGTDIKRSE
jgi:hypothetical protein